MAIIPDVSIKVEARQSDIPVVGNAIASGDDKHDAKVEREIIQRLKNGDISAWFDVLVTVSIEWSDDEYDYEYHGTDSLGGCSYTSVKEFVIQTDGYYGDMINQAWDVAIADAASDGITETIVKPDLTKVKPVICEC